MVKNLNQISTSWDKIERLVDEEGPRALINYMNAEYSKSLLKKVKERAYVDWFQAEEIVHDIFFDFIKNNYKLCYEIKKDRGKLRGLFFAIMRSKIYNATKANANLSDVETEEYFADDGDEVVNLYIDIHSVLDKLKEERSPYYQVVILRYIEGNSISEICEKTNLSVDAVKYRLSQARKWLSVLLKDYRKE